MLTANAGSYGHYHWKDLSKVPSAPGIYAWYLRPELREIDLPDEQETRRNLDRLIEALHIPALDVAATGHLSLEFEGSIRHVLRTTANGAPLPGLISHVLGDPKQRQSFASILRLAAPTLMSPLYVGVAINLCDRIKQHHSLLEYYVETADELEAKAGASVGHSFAFEVARRGIPLDSLHLFATPASGLVPETMPAEEQRRLVEAVETLLNRLFYPILGRR